MKNLFPEKDSQKAILLVGKLLLVKHSLWAGGRRGWTRLMTWFQHIQKASFEPFSNFVFNFYLPCLWNFNTKQRNELFKGEKGPKGMEDTFKESETYWNFFCLFFVGSGFALPLRILRIHVYTLYIVYIYFFRFRALISSPSFVFLVVCSPAERKK